VVSSVDQKIAVDPYPSAFNRVQLIEA